MAENPRPARSDPRKRENPVLRWLAFALCAGAFLGALFWKAVGW
ncbi:hypothetical protein [Stappia sp. WLB 29]|nr:hypothetical protein [Stappia sp. WLB 29]